MDGKEVGQGRRGPISWVGAGREANPKPALSRLWTQTRQHTVYSPGGRSLKDRILVLTNVYWLRNCPAPTRPEHGFNWSRHV